MSSSLRFRSISIAVVAAVAALLVSLAYAPQAAWADDQTTTDPASQWTVEELGWDPNDPSSWTEDQQPFYPDAAIDMSTSELLVYVAQIEATQGAGAGSGSSASSGSTLAPQSLSVESTNKLISAGCKYYGMRYVWGGRYAYQGGFDCTGFVIQCLDDAFGLKFDRAYTTAETLYNKYVTPVSNENAKPGDLIFWRGTYGSNANYISHVGIYCGGNIAFCAGDPIGFYDINKIRSIKGGYAPYMFGTPKGADNGDVTNDYYEQITDEDGKTTLRERKLMYRLYNRYSGEHLFTLDQNERDKISTIGWAYEGVAWETPEEGEEVYRVYNPYSGDHHYTMDAKERDNLVALGWKYEGVAWKSSGTTPVYRLFNPYEVVGTHHYTTSKQEYDALIKIGWRGEDVAWHVC